jgi:DNA polymerase
MQFREIDLLLYWIKERKEVQRRRESGAAPPWSSDPIFQNESFCNVEREDDRTTKWIRENWRDPHRDDPDVWFAMVIARLGGNHSNVLSQITLPLPWDKTLYLDEMNSKNLKIGAQAYRTWLSPIEGVQTHIHLAHNLFDPLWNARKQICPRPNDSCRVFYERLRAVPGLGSFLAAQVVADVKFTPPLCDAPDWWDFVAPGPGSRKGLNIVCGRDPKASWSDEAWLATFREFRIAIEPRLAELGLKLSASDLQNCLCELSKYHRAKTTGKISRPYRPAGTPAPKRSRKAPTPAVELPSEPVVPAPRAMPELTAARDPAAPHILHCDVETRSALDLTDCGAQRYAADTSTDVLCVAYAVDDEPVQLWARGDPVPSEFIEAARNPQWTATAHNANFERPIFEHVLGPRYGFPIVPVERWRCTMAQAYACALPGGLDKLAEVLQLAHRKDAKGARLMRLLSRPLAGGGWIEDAASLEHLHKYCQQDVEVERALSHRLPPLSDAEQKLWELDAKINARGVYTDGPLIEAAIRIADQIKQGMDEEISRITGGEVEKTTGLPKLRAWLAKRGAAVTDGQKATLKAALRRKNLDPAARRAIQLRLAAAHAVKVDTLAAWRSPDGRIRGALQFHGAATGRWAGRGPQLQNLTRDPGNVDRKISAIMAGDLSRYPEPLSAIADAARGAICAAPGQRFTSGDFSGIESRVLAWVAGETRKVEQWRKFDETGDPHDDPYFILGKALGFDDEHARAGGKVPDLAFGYMGGVNAYNNQASSDDTSSQEQRERFKQIWRQRHPRTATFWRAIDYAAIKAVRKPGTAHAGGRVSFEADDMFLKLTLPSGRIVRYPSPTIMINRFDEPAVTFMDTALGKWAPVNHGYGAYGGTWTENIVQAISRDLLAEAMVRLEAAGYPIVLTIHDEVVAEVPDKFGSLDEFKRLLITAPAWADGLPIAAKAREGARLSKPGGEEQFDDDNDHDGSDVDVPYLVQRERGHVVLIDLSGFTRRAHHTAADAVPVFEVMLRKLLRKLWAENQPTHLAAIGDAPGTTFRHAIYPEYKAGRPPPSEELATQLPQMHALLDACEIPRIEQAGFEADDLIATYARQATERGLDVTVIASDKDLMPLVSAGITLHDPVKGHDIDAAAVTAKFGVPPASVADVLALAGDAADNIPGVPKIGLKTAALLITEYGDLETLLSRADEIERPAWRNALIEHAPMARLSRRLVQLDDAIALDVPLDALRTSWTPKDRPEFDLSPMADKPEKAPESESGPTYEKAPFEAPRAHLTADSATGPAGPGHENPPPVQHFDFDKAAIDAAFAKPRKGNGHDPEAHYRKPEATGTPTAFFTYRHADGSNYLGVQKLANKAGFPQFHWTGSQWAKGAPQGPRIPYRLPELIKAPLDDWVLVCAGEKDADTAAGLGFAATSNPEGERPKAWRPELNTWFAGRKRVAIFEDNDATGRAHVAEVASALRGVVPDIRIVTFRELPEHGDLTDWLQNHTAAELRARIEAAKSCRPELKPAPIREWDGQPAPDIRYGVPDRFPMEVVNLFSGEGGGGKSTLTQQLGVAHALGREWLGCFPRQGPAIYVECEDPEKALHWRQKAIAEHYCVTQAAIADGGFVMLPLADGEESAILATASDKAGIIHPTPLYDQLYEMAGDIKPVIIGIASAAIVFAGNENVRPEVQQFMFLLRRLARVSGGYVLLVAQPSLTGIGDSSVSHAGLSGTTQWHNGCRGRAVLRAVKREGGVDTGLREIKFHKNQYGPMNASCFVRYTNGLFIPVAGMSMDGAGQAAKAEEVFITLLKKFTAQHQVVSHATGRNYAPARFAEQPEADGITKKDFSLAMQRLLDAGAIEIRSWGRPSHLTYYLAISGAS